MMKRNLLSAVNAVCCFLEIALPVASSMSQPCTQNQGPSSPIPTAVGIGRILSNRLYCQDRIMAQFNHQSNRIIAALVMAEVGYEER